MLLLHAGEVVSSDRMVDELWGERPPADAQTALQQHVSRLRKLLEPHSVLVTRKPGYMLELAPEAIDLERFRRLAGRGREELEQGRPAQAAQTLREALALWRGRPLADLENESFARDLAAALEEERLDALEARIEADLAAGRHAEVVGELRELVREHALRERPRRQLMLALYRSGRQAEALEVYADARRTLVDELGLEPGPELQRLQQAILAHDPELEAPIAPRAMPGGRRRIAVVGGLTALLLLLVSLGAALLLRDGGSSPAARAAVGPGLVFALDRASGEVRRRITAGRTPSAIAARDGDVWVVDADAQTVLRLSASSRVVETLSTGATPTDIALGPATAWVANGRPLEDAQFIGPVATSVARLDSATGTERGDTRLPRVDGSLSNLVENHLAVSEAALWAITPDFAVARIAASTGAVTAVSRAVRAAALAAGPDGVWVLGVDGAVVLLEENDARPKLRTRVPASSVGAIAAGADAAWVTSPADGRLWRIGGPRTPTLGAIELQHGVSDVVVAEDDVWVANPLAGVLVRVDPASATVEETVDLDAVPRSLAFDGETLWVAAGAEPSAAEKVSGVRVFASWACEPLVSGEAQADLLVVSDLPLQGGVRVRTTQMTEAIAFVLRERGFRAGRFRVAYQSCDDSVARTGLFDEAKCAANARAYAGNGDVVGVIGTFNSPCALAALPELNRAPEGPLAMVSPANSFVGLTRTGPGVDAALPASLYPTGRRSYVRVYPTDDLQGAALALFARDRGARRVYVLDDGDPGYGRLMATGFEIAARRLGLAVAGRASWDPQAAGYAELAEQVTRTRPDAVFVGGLLDTNAARVVRALRAPLGGQVDVLAPDGLTPLPLFAARAGDAALGTYVSLAGAVTERLPPAGERFVERFRATQPGVEIEPTAVYAAQATEVLLDAISRSDGTRAAVVDELFRTRVQDGLLGSFGFDENGDITESPVTILRVARRGSSNRVLSVEGGVVERVVRPSSRLVAADG